MARSRRETGTNDRLNLWIAFDYGGRAELVEAARRLVEAGVAAGRDRRGHVLPRDLYAPELPDPGPADPHLRRAADLELPALAARVRRARLRRHALAGLRARTTCAQALADYAQPAAPLRRRDELASGRASLVARRRACPPCSGSSGSAAGGCWVLALVGGADRAARVLRDRAAAAAARAGGLRRARCWRCSAPQLGGIVWMLGGFLATLALAFLLKGISRHAAVADGRGRRRRCSAPPGSASGSAHVAAAARRSPSTAGSPSSPSCSPSSRPTRSPTSPAALIGRHKLAPVLSPGQDVGGLGRVDGRRDPRAVLRALPRRDFLDDRRVARARRRRSRSPAPLGDLFESALKRDMEVKDTGRPARRPRRHARPVDALLFASIARVLRDPARLASRSTRSRDLGKPAVHFDAMKRIALLGATGSIGRQALEIVDGAPRARARRRRLRLAADRRARAADAGRRRPDRAARARRARRRPQRRRRLRRPAGDALGARARRRPRAREQGEPRRRGRARARGAGAGRRAAAPGRQRALGRLPVPRGPGAETGRLARR